LLNLVERNERNAVRQEEAPEKKKLIGLRLNYFCSFLNVMVIVYYASSL
jgi:hypothetical protein